MAESNFISRLGTGKVTEKLRALRRVISVQPRNRPYQRYQGENQLQSRKASRNKFGQESRIEERSNWEKGTPELQGVLGKSCNVGPTLSCKSWGSLAKKVAPG